MHFYGGDFHFNPSSMEFKPIFFLIPFFSISLTLIYSVFKRLKKTKTERQIKNPATPNPDSTHLTHCDSANWVGLFGPEPGLVDSDCEKTEQQMKNPIIQIPDPTHFTPPGSTKWVGLFGSDPVQSGPDCEKKKRKKKKGKKEDMGEKEKEGDGDLVGLYPFTTSSSVMQRKIKKQYDELIKSHGSNGLTLRQVGQFVNCLVEARNDLKHKSEVIQRKFTITKALLLKAERSSFVRLSLQINKLELEYKRIEEDVLVYNRLQQQLKLSPAYKKMLEIGACMELKAKSMELAERADDEFSDISFEELLEQEKKDSFWQKNRKH